jgi:alanine-glyoxylate transaminase/serine-glyoxylate transaminase/serine-pyruvate transaminase
MDEGLEAVWDRHATIGAGVRAAVAQWGQDGPLEMNIRDDAECSNSVSAILTGSIDPESLRSVAEAQLGVTLGNGLGQFAASTFRIGHMGHVNAPMILGTLGVVEIALANIGAPFTSGGVEAAAKAMAGGVA